MIRSTLASAAVLALAVPLAGPAVADVINGTADDDRLTGTAPATDSTGSDTIQGFGGDDRIRGKGGSDALLGGEGHDFLWTGAGRFDSAEGGAGDDVMVSIAQYGYMEGNEGADLMVARLRENVQVNRVYTYMRGNEGGDSFSGNQAAQGVEPDHGADTMRLRGGDDYVFIWPDSSEPGGETSTDHIFCGGGIDTVEVYGGKEDPNDTLHGCEDVFLPRQTAEREPQMAPERFARLAR
jgi:Ca2+-binding RTX toxin-like protein